MGSAFGSLSIFYTQIGGELTSLGTALGTLEASIETKALNIGVDKFTYFIDQVTTHLEDNADIKRMVLEIYGAEKEDGPFVLLDTIDLSLEDPGFTDPPGMRYYKLIYIDTAVSKRWRLHGFDVYGEPGGEEY
jgi:hypothetical protein